MRKRVILKHGFYWPQYKFIGLMWRYYEEAEDPFRLAKPVGFASMLDAINYCGGGYNQDTKEEVVWQGN